MPLEFGGRGAPVDRFSQVAEQVADHRVVSFERAKHRRKVGVRLLDSGKQGAVFSPVVPVEGGAEAVTVEQQVAAGLLGVAAVAHGFLGEAQGIADAPVHGA